MNYNLDRQFLKVSSDLDSAYLAFSSECLGQCLPDEDKEGKRSKYWLEQRREALAEAAEWLTNENA